MRTYLSEWMKRGRNNRGDPRDTRRAESGYRQPSRRQDPLRRRNRALSPFFRCGRARAGVVLPVGGPDATWPAGSEKRIERYEGGTPARGFVLLSRTLRDPPLDREPAEWVRPYEARLRR